MILILSNVTGPKSLAASSCTSSTGVIARSLPASASDGRSVLPPICRSRSFVHGRLASRPRLTGGAAMRVRGTGGRATRACPARPSPLRPRAPLAPPRRRLRPLASARASAAPPAASERRVPRSRQARAARACRAPHAQPLLSRGPRLPLPPACASAGPSCSLPRAVALHPSSQCGAPTCAARLSVAPPLDGLRVLRRSASPVCRGTFVHGRLASRPRLTVNAAAISVFRCP